MSKIKNIIMIMLILLMGLTFTNLTTFATETENTDVMLISEDGEELEAAPWAMTVPEDEQTNTEIEPRVMPNPEEETTTEIQPRDVEDKVEEGIVDDNATTTGEDVASTSNATQSILILVGILVIVGLVWYFGLKDTQKETVTTEKDNKEEE